MQYAVSAKVGTYLMAVKEGIRNAIVEYNAWFLILLAVLLSIAFTVYAGLQIWCVVYKGKTFTGKWNWSKNGIEVRAECK